MVEADLLLGHLRGRVKDLHSLLQYLESRQVVGPDDYSYSQSRLRELIRGIKVLERFASERGSAHALRAAWLN